MPWWAASIVANVFIAVVEYANRTGGFPAFHRALLVTAPFILVAQWGLWRAWAGAPSLMFAWAFFTVGNSVVRVASAQWAVKEPPTAMTLAGVGLMFLAAYLIKIGAK